ncbi:MAG TPA: hypothetical protein VL996_10580 [Methylocella sp.]|nr:hypothetical protein [Methylocella sp.]
MSLSEDDLKQIDEVLVAPNAESYPFGELRRRFPHLSWTRCDASDVTETPFRVYEHFDIHLLNSTDHCAQITTDPARATGIILASRSAIR